MAQYRGARTSVNASAEQQPVRISELVAVDPLGEHRDEHGCDRDTAWFGLGFAGLDERESA